jgi:hypothetical protein
MPVSHGAGVRQVLCYPHETYITVDPPRGASATWNQNTPAGKRSGKEILLQLPTRVTGASPRQPVRLTATPSRSRERARLLALGHPLPASSRRARARAGFPEHSPFFSRKKKKMHTCCPVLCWAVGDPFGRGLKKVRNAGAAGLGCGVVCGVVVWWTQKKGAGNPLRGT